MGQSEREIYTTKKNFKTAQWFCSFYHEGRKPSIDAKNGFFYKI
jgi:hypothetical protein